MMFLPKRINENNELEVIGLTEEMKNQGFLWENAAENDLYSFKITKEQYYELTKSYFEAEEAADLVSLIRVSKQPDGYLLPPASRCSLQ